MKLKELKGKYAFISHPFANDPEGNRKKVDKVCKYWVKKGVIPISPLHLFSFYEDDSNRDEIMNVCYKLIDIADVVFVYGDSEGCRLEKAYAEGKGKPVFVFMEEKELTYEDNYKRFTSI